MFNEDNNKYLMLLNNLKKNIATSQQESVITVNKKLFMLYWNIGNLILDKHSEQEYENNIIDNLSKDLKIAFPNMQGFSERNLKYMYKFAEEYKEEKFVKQIASKISWSHNIILMNKISDLAKRIYYINKVIENKWSSDVLLSQIELEYVVKESETIETTSTEANIKEDYSIDAVPLKCKPLENNNLENNNIITNTKGDYTIGDNVNYSQDGVSIVEAALPVQLIKDPYMLDLLTFLEEDTERDLEKQFVNHIIKYFLQLNSGFAFVGNKYHLRVADEDYYIDLLFYNLKLRCYISIELIIGNFKPEHLGKLSFHLSLIDDTLKLKEDKPSIGIVLCKDDESLFVQYAFKDITTSTGYAEYNLIQDIPDEFKLILPTVKNIGLGIKENLKC